MLEQFYIGPHSIVLDNANLLNGIDSKWDHKMFVILLATVIREGINSNLT